ncbi:putative fluoride ion transporter CrcB [Clostridium acetireducens DSM 10703]|uniref:Fluoride-specific ion channel FluC n=1 Tax=Clostridium acetireducens DSM 10703 TaxID=1121290 RepID=A0A1E8EYL3_9CLOT|nr:fluoride efflux transporter CrcB [Clostridium acetireducens]OFI06067.1 putative fluoride ion transporter CrcB [Clostridium acetireducens DSM 10703]
MEKIFFVGLGGFIGASTRYLISNMASKYFYNYIPYGTLVVNILGAFLMGAIMEVSIKYNLISPNLRIFLTTGILGGLTTFSTFSYETVNIFQKGNYILASINASLNLFLSLLFVFIGKYIIQIL